MQDLLSILSLFRKKFNEFNNTGARKLDSIYHMTFKLFCNCVFVYTMLWVSFGGGVGVGGGGGGGISSDILSEI